MYFAAINNMFNWLQNHLIPCPFKTLTGLDCPGCGFQRSLIQLIKGNLSQSWHLYPPTIPLLLLFLSVGIMSRYPIKNKRVITKTLVLIVGNFVLISYAVKIFSNT